MDPLQPHFVRPERSDAVRQWAALEGKSETKSDDLCQQHSMPAKSPSKKRPRFELCAELLFATLEAWMQFRSR